MPWIITFITAWIIFLLLIDKSNLRAMFGGFSAAFMSTLTDYAGHNWFDLYRFHDVVIPWGVRFFFLFLRLLRCFSSPGALRTPMDSVYGDGGSPPPGCPIRISTDRGLLAAPRSFSQLTTSFFGPVRLGIHRMLFVA
jgi:hypothetical protein